MIGNNSSNDKNIVLTPSLLMRLFEWCHEDAANDVAMHKAFEKIVSFNDGVNPLNMESYDIIINGANDGQEPKSTDEDLANAEELGKEVADCGVNLEDVGYSDASFLINMKRGDEFGSSNDEIESFWKGYKAEYDLPLENGETQVNGQLVDELENAVDSYHEGGISGNDCYNAIQQAFANNEQCVDCSRPQISYNDIETYSDSFNCDNCCCQDNPCEEGMTLTIDCDTGEVNDIASRVVQPEELSADTMDQINQVIKLGGLSL